MPQSPNENTRAVINFSVHFQVSSLSKVKAVHHYVKVQYTLLVSKLPNAFAQILSKPIQNPTKICTNEIYSLHGDIKAACTPPLQPSHHTAASLVTATYLPCSHPCPAIFTSHQSREASLQTRNVFVLTKP